MHRTYPQQTQGTTLLKVEYAGEYRRVFACDEQGGIHVGEFTRGPLTDGIYGTPAHFHGLRVTREAAELGATRLRSSLGGMDNVGFEGLLALYFVDGERFLADLLDDLDAWDVPYAYLNVEEGGRIAYRPGVAHASGTARSVHLVS